LTQYEILLLLDPELPEERQTEIVTRVRELAEKSGGSWVSHDVWGRRRLAYEIDKKAEGAYHLLNLDAEPATLDEISRILKITDGVMRHLAVHRIEGRGTGYRPEPEPAAVGADVSHRSDDTDGTRQYAGQIDSPEEEE
jgi:small subunit ribosomal protein S6